MQGARHARCREIPGGLVVPGLGVTSFPGIQQIIHVWGGSTYAGVADGTMARPFTTITAALVAAAALVPGAANRILILVWPGTYVEALTAVAYVDIVGVDRDSCVVQEASALTDAVGNTTYRRLTFISETGLVVAISAAARVEFFDCVFICNQTALIDMDVNYVNITGTDARFWSCVFLTPSALTWSTIHVAGIAVALFHGCEIQAHYIVLSNTAAVTFEECIVTSLYSENLISSYTTGTLVIRYSSFASADRHCIALFATPGTCILQDNILSCGGQHQCVYADAARAGLVIEQNTMLVGGIHQNVSHLSPERIVGSSGMRDWYGTTQEALTSCTFDDIVIRLWKDETLLASLTAPASRIVTIDGNGKHSLLYGTSRVIIPIRGTVTLRDLYIKGEIYIADAGGVVNLIIERCYIDGRVVGITTGATSTLLIVDSTIIPSDALSYPLGLFTSNLAYTVKRSYLRGRIGTANPAIYFNAVINTLNLKESTIFHGIAAAGNNPFGQPGALGPITYDAHQCAFNDDPDTVAGSIWTNNVPPAQRFHTIDPGAGY